MDKTPQQHVQAARDANRVVVWASLHNDEREWNRWRSIRGQHMRAARDVKAGRPLDPLYYPSIGVRFGGGK